jgi:hypothetical protein
MNDYEMIPSMNNVNMALPVNRRSGSRQNADRQVNTACKDLGTTREGRDWLKAALDPFHDTQLEVVGMPDGTNALSTRQIVTLAGVITSTTGPWDVSIVDWPTVTSGNKPTYSQYTAYSVGPNGPQGAFQVGSTVSGLPIGLGWIQAATGVSLDWTSAAGFSGGNLLLPNTYGQSPYRVISKGFEVYNTSNVLNQGGNIVCWTQNMPDIKSASPQLVTNASYANPGFMGFALAPGPPSSLGNAEILPNSTNWLAAQGCYVPGRLSSTDIPTSTATTNQFMYYGNVPTTGPYLSASPLTVGPANTGQISSQQSCNLTGAYITGLPANATLLVRYRLVIELFPSFGDSLLSSARPSPAYDPLALELYSRALRTAPVGVPVCENGLGDWFKSVASTVANLPVIRSLVKVPGKLVSGVEAVVEKAANSVQQGDFNGAATELSQLAPQGKMAKLLSGKPLTTMSKNKNGRNQNKNRRR